MRIAALQADTVLVEGVGGWAVPISLDPPLWVADLARATRGSVLVVAANRIGVINHTLLTVAAIRRAELPVAAVVLNRLPTTPADPSQQSNEADLAEILDVPVVGVAPLRGGQDAEERVGDRILRAIVGGSPAR